MENIEQRKDSNISTIDLTVKVVTAYLNNNSIKPDEITDLLSTIYSALEELKNTSKLGEKVLIPAVPLKKSITPDYLICLEDGKKLKMLKRHIFTSYGLSPKEYRDKWNLPPDYPMVAPNYAKKRSLFAKQFGLGKNTAYRNKPW